MVGGLHRQNSGDNTHIFFTWYNHLYNQGKYRLKAEELIQVNEKINEQL